VNDQETLAALIKDAYYAARDNGGTMHTAADDAAKAIVAAGWTPPTTPGRVQRYESSSGHGEISVDPACVCDQGPRARALSDADRIYPRDMCPVHKG